jgi:CBS domain-containing protein
MMIDACRSLGLCIAGLIAVSVLGADRASDKQWPPIVLANHFSCYDPTGDQDRGCGFLVKYNDRVYAVSAKHVLAALAIKGVKGLEHVSLQGVIKELSMFSKDAKSEKVIVGKLLNEGPHQKLASPDLVTHDWLVFAINRNESHIQPLEIRKMPLQRGEKVYVVGWTSDQKDGPQRTYEFEYYKSVGTHVLLKERLVPAKLGGLSGAPVVDGTGSLVGIVSNSTVDPETGSKFFSPCSATDLAAYLASLPL